MRWLQVVHRQSREIRLGMLEGPAARGLRRPIGGILTVLDLLRSRNAVGYSDWVNDASADGHFQDVSWSSLLAGSDRDYHLTAPLTPPEVWGCGVTYRRSAEFRDEGSGIYDHIYSAERPELFSRRPRGGVWDRASRLA
jgi:hypothetical protein